MSQALTVRILSIKLKKKLNGHVSNSYMNKIYVNIDAERKTENVGLMKGKLGQFSSNFNKTKAVT